MPFISVIIPVYKVEQYVGLCVDSVVNQTFRDFELILVDDCSPDRSMEIAKGIAVKASDISVTYLRTPVNSGMSVARNMGIDAARGEYLFFSDSDDFLSADCLERLSEVAREHPDADIVYGSSEEIRDGIRLGYNEYYNLANRPSYISNLSALRKMMLSEKLLPIHIWNRLFRRSWFSSNGFRFQPGILAQDFHLDFFFAKHAKAIAICPAVTYFYRLHSGCVSIARRDFQDRCVEWAISDWMRHLSLPGLPSQLKLICTRTHRLYLRKYYGRNNPSAFFRYIATVRTLILILLRNKSVPTDNR